MNDRTTALTVAQPQTPAATNAPAPIALNPQSLTEAMKLSEYLAKSEIIPIAFRGRPADVFVAIGFGAELGMPPMSSLRNVFILDGRPTISADGAHGVAISHPECDRFYRDNERSELGKREVWICVRNGEPHEGEFTIEMAAHLMKKDNWRNYPADMLKARARLRAAKLAFPDRLGGILTREEIQDGILDLEERAPDRFSAPPPPLVNATLTDRERARAHREAEESLVREAEESVVSSEPHTDDRKPEPPPPAMVSAGEPSTAAPAVNDEPATHEELERRAQELSRAIAAAKTEQELEVLTEPCRAVKLRDKARGDELVREYLDRRNEIRHGKKKG